MEEFGRCSMTDAKAPVGIALVIIRLSATDERKPVAKASYTVPTNSNIYYHI